jgi:hypothetical protein
MVALDVYLTDATLIREWIEGDQIILDNVPLRVERGYGYSLTNVYGRKEQHGEPGPEDHQYTSTNTQRTWLGGQLRRDAEETGETGRWWKGHAWTQTRGALGHALKVDRIGLPEDAPLGQVVPLGRLGDDFYWSVGDINGRIYRHDEPTHTALDPLSGAMSFVGTVMNVGAVFQTEGDTDDEADTWMYVPTTTGYTRFALDGTVTHAPLQWQHACVGMAVNENRLYRLNTNGKVFFLIDHDDRWEYAGTLPDGSDPQNIYQTYDDDGNRVIGVTSTSGLWMLDHDNQMLLDTDLTFPEHAYQGLGAVNWRGDDYISVGVGVHRKAGTLVVAAGLDEDDGLPNPFSGGFITHLARSYNLLIAAVAGQPAAENSESGIPEEEMFGVTQGLPYPIVGLGTQARFVGKNRLGAIFCWNGLGWSEMYTWNRPPTRAIVTMIRNASLEDRYQHLFFGDNDGGAYAIHVPMTYYNPLESPNLPLDRESYLEESRIDWNMPDVPKIAKQINIKPDHLWHKIEPDQVDPYLNRIQIICNWIDLDGHEHTSEDPDVMNGPGPYPFSDGDQPLPYLELRADVKNDNSRRSASIGWERYRNTGVLLPTGLPHEAIWMTYRFLGDPRNDYTGGVIQWRTILARKWMRPNRVFTFQVNAATANKGLSETEILHHLDNVCLKKSGVPLVNGDEFLIVDVTRLDGSGEAGLSPRGMRTISCLEFTDHTYEDVIHGPD